ncbi:hypothetical protein C8F04DRAFT_1264488 [Mycena alexandri]|uniref:Uncharacterized protein n=1 Tax=Mycena alexandri TaxID=1745969 RepID=A0AAD6SP21_9AGAR|nr:hypothetical protein C8F04DRAFT_1264488 [Mycena alexandri]
MATPATENIIQIQECWAGNYRRPRQPRRRRPPPSNHSGDVPSFFPNPAYTFTQERSGYLLTTAQNNGSLLTTRIGSNQPLVPAAKPAAWKPCAAAVRAQARLDAQPTAEELLLQRLTAGTRSRKRSSEALVDESGFLQEQGRASMPERLTPSALIPARPGMQHGERYILDLPIAHSAAIHGFHYDPSAWTPRRTLILMELGDLRRHAQDFKDQMPRDEASWRLFLIRYRRFQYLMRMLPAIDGGR